MMPAREKYIVSTEEEGSPTSSSGGGGVDGGEIVEEKIDKKWASPKMKCPTVSPKVLSSRRPMTRPNRRRRPAKAKIYNHDPLTSKI